MSCGELFRFGRLKEVSVIPNCFQSDTSNLYFFYLHIAYNEYLHCLLTKYNEEQRFFFLHDEIVSVNAKKHSRV